MAVKTKDNFQSSFFLDFDVQENGSVIVTCDTSMQDKVQTLLTHLENYLAEMFSIII